MINWLINRYLNGPNTPVVVLTMLAWWFGWILFFFVTDPNLWK